MTHSDIDLDLNDVRKRLLDGESVDEPLPEGGRLYIDRPMPFLCLYRKNPSDSIAPRLVTSQSSYAIVPASDLYHVAVEAVVDLVAEVMTERYDRFLLLELWCRSTDPSAADPYDLQPEFRVFAPDTDLLRPTVEALAKGAQRVTIQHFIAKVSVNCTKHPAPPDATPLDGAVNGGLAKIGLEVEPVFTRGNPDGGVYPFLFDSIRTQLSDALRKALFVFSDGAREFDAPGFLALGRRALEDAVREVDRGLARIDESFDFLLQTTPINADEAWTGFREDDFETEPVFRYRPLPIDPNLLKRRLYALPLERVEDPSLHDIFREKQEELDRQVTMLSDRGTRQFFFESLQLYGEVSSHLLQEARSMLDDLPQRDYDDDAAEHLDAVAFAEVAAAELRYYRQVCSDFPETVQIRHDMPPGLMVSRGQLLIGHQTQIPAARVEALLHHEVGTHMLTYFNGRVQPLGLLYNGLARYESLQEGIAVLSEYLVGGLNVPRLRVLAARVVAAHCMIDGCSFVDLYRLLLFDYGFAEHEAFSISLRTFRGGGQIKDVIYLRGLHELMHFLEEGGALDDLFVGKMALHHLPALRELRARGILRDAPLRPRYLEDDRVSARLERVRQGTTFLHLIEQKSA